jgi:hypothetical protein
MALSCEILAVGGKMQANCQEMTANPDITGFLFRHQQSIDTMRSQGTVVYKETIDFAAYGVSMIVQLMFSGSGIQYCFKRRETNSLHDQRLASIFQQFSDNF